MNILKNIATILSVVIFAACCGAFVLFSVSGTGWKALSVPTGSMRPAMPPGSLVLTHSVPAKSLKVGDVITYVNPLDPKTTITHRIIKTYSIGGKVPGFVTKGDANKSADIPIGAGSVKGKVAWHVAHAGTWLQWAKSWPGLIAIVYIPALLLIIEEIGRLNKYYKTTKLYRVWGFIPREQPGTMHKGFAAGTLSVLTFLIIGGIVAEPVLALLSSNTVALTNNNLSVAPNSGQCTGNTTNNTSVNINNSSTQTATTGSANSSGNTSGGSASSGNASNSNSTNINVNIANGC